MSCLYVKLVTGPQRLTDHYLDHVLVIFGVGAKTQVDRLVLKVFNLICILWLCMVCIVKLGLRLQSLIIFCPFIGQHKDEQLDRSFSLFVQILATGDFYLVNYNVMSTNNMIRYENSFKIDPF